MLLCLKGDPDGASGEGSSKVYDCGFRDFRSTVLSFIQQQCSSRSRTCCLAREIAVLFFFLPLVLPVGGFFLMPQGRKADGISVAVQPSCESFDEGA